MRPGGVAGGVRKFSTPSVDASRRHLPLKGKDFAASAFVSMPLAISISLAKAA